MGRSVSPLLPTSPGWSTDLRRTIRNRRWTVALLFSFFMGAVWLVTLCIPPRHVAEVSLLAVPPIEERLVIAQALLNSPLLVQHLAGQVDPHLLEPSMHPQHLPGRLLAQAVHYLDSQQSRIRRAWVRTGLAAPRSSKAIAPAIPNHAIKVRRDRDRPLIHLSITLANPVLARQLAAEAVEWINPPLVADPPSSLSAPALAPFGPQRIDLLDQETDRIRRQYRLVAPETQRALILGRLDEIGRCSDQIQRELALLNADGVGLAPQPVEPAQLAGPPSPIAAAAEVDLIQHRIAQLQVDRVRLLNTYTTQSRQVQRIDLELEQLGALLRRGMLLRQRELERQAARLEAELAQIDTGASQLARPDRQRALALMGYLRQPDSDGAYAPTSGRPFIVLEGPFLRSIRPAPLRTLLLASPLALLIAILLTFVLERRRDRITSRADLARIEGLTYLGSFHLSPPLADPLAGRRRRDV